MVAGSADCAAAARAEPIACGTAAVALRDEFAAGVAVLNSGLAVGCACCALIGLGLLA